MRVLRLEIMRRISWYLAVAVVIGMGVWVYLNRAGRMRSFPYVPAPVHAKDQYAPPRAWLAGRVIVVVRSVDWDGAVKAQADDEIWNFYSPLERWKQEMGTAGRCLLRKGVIVDGYVTMVN